MQIARKILLALLALTAVFYGGDFIYAHARKAPFADVHIDRYFAVAEKYNKISYERTDPITERCVYSMFPQYGYNPCWYVMRHTLRFISVG